MHAELYSKRDLWDRSVDGRIVSKWILNMRWGCELTPTIMYETWGSRGGKDVDIGLLDCNAALTCTFEEQFLILTAQVVHNKVRWRILVNTVMKPRVPQRQAISRPAGELFTTRFVPRSCFFSCDKYSSASITYAESHGPTYFIYL
jgi:hypothetical protein